jgi:hypothetical protein
MGNQTSNSLNLNKLNQGGGYDRPNGRYVRCKSDMSSLGLDMSDQTGLHDNLGPHKLMTSKQNIIEHK